VKDLDRQKLTYDIEEAENIQQRYIYWFGAIDMPGVPNLK
jgi:hypothetical protein